MGFEVVRRRGRVWEDTKILHSMLMKFPFQTTGGSERDFERGFATTLINNREDYNLPVHSQIDRDTQVESIYCFGKKHRPDVTLGENGVAIEMKYISYAGLKDAIGQGYLYRLRYKFVFIVLIFSEDRKDVYHEIEEGKEKDLEDMLTHLEEEMNIFTYIVPSFKPKGTAVRKVISFSPDEFA